MKPKPLVIGAALALTAVVGFVAGRSTAGNATGPGVAESGRERGTAGSERGVSGRSGASLADPKSSRTGKTPLPAGSADRKAKLEEIVRGEDPLGRNRALMAYIDQLGPADFEEAVASFREMGITESRMGEYSLLLTAWAEVDPMSALKFAEENTRGGFARDTILTGWAGKDPQAAIQWAKANFQGEEGEANPFLPGIIRGLVGVDPEGATALLASMPRSEERGRGLDFMLPHLLSQGSDSTRDWINGLTDPALRDGAMMRAAQQLASLDPAGTAKWLAENPGEASRRRMDDVYGTWASNDPQAALASFNALPAGELRSDALRGVVSSMTAEKPQDGLALMNRYPNDINDGVVRDFVWHAFGSDPAMAANQISRINDPRERNQMYVRAVGEWMNRDKTAATAWIQANALPDDVRNELLGGDTP